MLPVDVIEKIKRKVPFYQKNCLENIFSWNELENILNLRPFVTTKRFVVVNNEKNYQWPNRDWLTEPDSIPPNIIQDIVDNKVCYIRDATRVNKKVNYLAMQLEQHSGCSTDAHIYFSKNISSKSFDIHNDLAHNFIVQIEGQTRFKIWNFETTNKEDRWLKTEMKEDPFIDVIMNPGDVVFIPVYYWHQAISQTKRMSISFPMAPQTTNFQERGWVTL
jgi:hypothetical protein